MATVTVTAMVTDITKSEPRGFFQKNTPPLLRAIEERRYICARI